MAVKLIVGMQWGDEGKGKIIDQIAHDADYVVRFQGGSNAGHTVVAGETEIVLHLIPSGVLHAGKVCVIGNGVVVDPAQLLAEMRECRAKGFAVTPDNLRLSDRAHLVFPYHKLADEIREEHRGEMKLGTTKRGIGPTYSDKASRLGIRVCDMFEPDYFRARVAETVQLYNSLQLQPAGRPPMNAVAIADEYLRYAAELKPHVTDTAVEINRAVGQGKSVLLESAQGAMLDIDYGTYPFVTSSNASGSGVFSGSGLRLGRLDDVIGILKAYTTRVGSGPFPTELKDATGEHLRKIGGEFGATTGRPRRCGWQDMVVARYTAMISGVTAVALTKLDVMNQMPRIRVCAAYRLRGRETTEFPAFVTEAMDFAPVYREFDGWMQDLSGITKYDKLPDKARRYIEALEDMLGIPIRMISVGRRRGEFIER